MPTPPVPKERVQEVIDKYVAIRGPERAWNRICGELGLSCSKSSKRYIDEFAGRYGITVPPRLFETMSALDRADVEIQIKHGIKPPGSEFSYTPLPDPELSFDELVEQRIQKFEKKRAFEDARRLITVNVKVHGPVGIWHFGDPHLDDDGTDLGAALRDADTVRKTDGLFGANVGDTTNNWIGRLARLWAQQSTTSTEAWKLAEGFLKKVDWLYLIGGNHDAWSGAGDPIKWIQRGNSAPYMSSEVRLELKFPNGSKCRINAHHDFNGHSQYNPAHGPMKATMFGHRDHIAVAGHKHISGHGVLKCPSTGTALHSFLVAGYKIYDRFALEKGFRDQHISPGVFTVIHVDRPETHPDYITFFWTMEAGLDYLKFLRRKK